MSTYLFCFVWYVCYDTVDYALIQYPVMKTLRIFDWVHYFNTVSINFFNAFRQITSINNNKQLVYVACNNLLYKYSIVQEENASLKPIT